MSLLEWLETETKTATKGLEVLDKIKQDSDKKSIKGSDGKKIKNYTAVKPSKNKHGKTVAELEFSTILRKIKKQQYQFGVFISGNKCAKTLKHQRVKWKDKPRVITRDCARDYFAQKLVLTYLEEHFTHSFASYGYQKGKSAFKAVEELKTQLAENLDYNKVYTFDIAKFFDTISHDIIMQKIKHYFPDDPILYSFIGNYITSRCFQPDESLFYGSLTLSYQKKRYFAFTPEQKRQYSQKRTKGIYQGGVLSGFLANLVLHELDELMSNKEDVIYMRYADDFIIIQQDTNKALSQKTIFAEVEECLKERKLELSVDKCEEFFMTKSTPVKFLGFKLYRNSDNPSKIVVGLKGNNYRKVEERFSVYKQGETFYQVKRTGTCLALNNEHYLNWYPHIRSLLNKIDMEIKVELFKVAWVLKLSTNKVFWAFWLVHVRVRLQDLISRKDYQEKMFPKWIEIENNTIDLKEEILKLLRGRKDETSNTFSWFSYFRLVNDEQQLDGLSKILRLRTQAIKNKFPEIALKNKSADFRKMLSYCQRTPLDFFLKI